MSWPGTSDVPGHEPMPLTVNKSCRESLYAQVDQVYDWRSGVAGCLGAGSPDAVGVMANV